MRTLSTPNDNLIPNTPMRRCDNRDRCDYRAASLIFDKLVKAYLRWARARSSGQVRRRPPARWRTRSLTTTPTSCPCTASKLNDADEGILALIAVARST